MLYKKFFYFFPKIKFFSNTSPITSTISEESMETNLGYEEGTQENKNQNWYAKEYWSGDALSGEADTDGYNYYYLDPKGMVLDAYEYVEDDAENICITRIKNLLGVNWFEYFEISMDEVQELEILEIIKAKEFLKIKQLYALHNTK
jgi:hypothetical protein